MSTHYQYSPAGSPERRKVTPGKTYSPSGASLPVYNEFTTSPSVAAGVPVLELVRKFEEEKILTREDRIALNDALYNPERRDGIVKALRDLELGDGSRFAVRRLKALIHQNGTGEISSRAFKEQQERLKSLSTQQSTDLQQGQASSIASNDVSPAAAAPMIETIGAATAAPAPLKSPRKQTKSTSPGRRKLNPSLLDSDDRSQASALSQIYDTQSAIIGAVGSNPVYSDPENFNICHKITRRLREFLVRMKAAPTQTKRTFAILVGSGSFNPLTRMHLRSYFVAKQHLEGNAGFVVLGSLLSPSHGMTVRERYRSHPKEVIPSPHRLAIAQLMVQESKWLAIDPWEMTRRRPMDTISLLQHARDTVLSNFPNLSFKIMYLCKPNAVPLLSPQTFKDEGFGVVCPCRAVEYDALKKSLSAKWNGVICCVEDTALVDASMDVTTSRKVRDRVRAYGNIDHLVGRAIDLYCKLHRIGVKMNGDEPWTEEEKALSPPAARPFTFTLKSQEGLFSGSSLMGPLTGMSNPNPTPSTSSFSSKPGYTPSWQNMEVAPQVNRVMTGTVHPESTPAPSLASVAEERTSEMSAQSRIEGLSIEIDHEDTPQTFASDNAATDAQHAAAAAVFASAGVVVTHGLL